MPHRTYPIGPDGPVLFVTVGLTGAAYATLQQVGQPLPLPRTVPALLDTGADLTNLSLGLIAYFQLQPFASATSVTAGGSINLQLYRISLSIPHPGPAASILEVEDLIVMEMLHPPPNVEVVLGMNAIQHCLLVLDGPRREFTLGD